MKLIINQYFSSSMLQVNKYRSRYYTYFANQKLSCLKIRKNQNIVQDFDSNFKSILCEKLNGDTGLIITINNKKFIKIIVSKCSDKGDILRIIGKHYNIYDRFNIIIKATNEDAMFLRLSRIKNVRLNIVVYSHNNIEFIENILFVKKINNKIFYLDNCGSLIQINL